MHTLAPLLALLAVAAAPAAAQTILLEIPYSGWYLDYGAAVAFWPDLDGDGRDDVAIGTPDFYAGKASMAGIVSVHSSRDGSRLLAFEGDTEYGQFGAALARLGDADGDGVDDMAIGEVHGVKTGRVHVRSGATGDLVHILQPKGFADSFGYAVAAAGDWDGDGRADVAVGDPGRNASHGEVSVYSGLTGKRIFAWTDTGFFLLGASVAGIGDVNGDGVADILAGAPAYNSGPGAVVIAGGSGTVLHRFHPALPEKSQFGHAVAGLGDVDGDGLADYAIAAPAARWDLVAYVAVYSGATHTLLWKVGHPVAGDFGWSLTAVGDVDQDGAPDLAVGQPGEFGVVGSSLSILSGATGRLLGRHRETTLSFGRSLAGGSDVDGDGLADLVAGRPDELPGDTSVAVISPR